MHYNADIDISLSLSVLHVCIFYQTMPWIGILPSTVVFNCPNVALKHVQLLLIDILSISKPTLCEIPSP